MPDERFVTVGGSHRSVMPNAKPAGRLDPAAEIGATIVLRRRTPLPRTLVECGPALDHPEFVRRHGADPDDLALAHRVLTEHGLRVLRTDQAGRRMVVAGTAERFADVLGARLRMVTASHPFRSGDVTYRHQQGDLRVPAELADVVVAVLGLDDRPQARAHWRSAAASAVDASFTPPQLAEVYRFPTGVDGHGQTIAIIELGGGFDTADLDRYFPALGLRTPTVRAVGVDGATNQPTGDPNSADGEVGLDIEVAGGVAPGADQVVYFAPNTDQGFVDALSTAVHADPTPVAVSISWGGPEDGWSTSARTALDDALADAAALGITVTAAAGDAGSSDGATDGAAHTDFPASSPHALGCGGTSLSVDDTGAVRSETVWHGRDGGATGGGVSTVFELPSWQSRAGVPPRPGGGAGRGVPDVAADADPATGYQVFVDGKEGIVGGTSAVAPLWAGLVARLAQATGHRLGLLQPKLYAGAAQGEAAPGFRDVVSGGNGRYEAGPGWDPCTGLGVPDGVALSRLFGTR